MSLVDYIDSKGEIRKGPIKPKHIKKKTGSFKSYDIFGAMIMPLLIGVIGGYYLDLHYGKSPYFTIGGLVLGIITIIYNLLKLFQN
jgi:F0F1-type ATP synthase assembly protein I